MKEQLVDFIKTYILYILGAACIVVIGVVYLMWQNSPTVVVWDAYDPGVPAGYDDQDIEPVPHEPVAIWVHVAGEVHSPGMFEFFEGQRVYHAVARAGGETEYADVHKLNLAAPLHDAMRIVVPAIGDNFVYEPNVGEIAPGVQQDGRININTATAAQLQTLPQIGVVRAQSIIDFRTQNGNFASVDDLAQVHNISTGIVNGLRDLVTVR